MARRTYTVKSGDNWFKIAQRVFGDQNFAARLADRNPGVTLSPGVVIKTSGIATQRVGGGAALAAMFPGVSPTGVAPTDAVTPLAEEGFLGLPAEVTGTVPYEGIVQPTRPPAELAPQALRAGPEQLPTVRPPAELAPQALRGGVEGAVAPGFAPAPISAIDVSIPERPIPTAWTDLPEGERIQPGMAVSQTGIYSPVAAAAWQRLEETLGGEWVGPGISAIGQAAARGVNVIGRAATDVLGLDAAGEPTIADTTIMPIDPQSTQAIYLAARWTGEAIMAYGRARLDPTISSSAARAMLPNVITTPVALHLTGWLETPEGEDILTVNNLFNADNLSYTEIEPGVWVKNPEVTYTGGYTGAVGYTGRRYGRGRGTRGGRTTGAGGTQYGPRLTQWRIGFGG